MKYSIPEISWHNRDPVLSVDFQPLVSGNSDSKLRRLATAGTDSHVLIWHVSVSESGAVSLDVAADLTRHQKAVNVARWSPSGELLATGDDEAIIMLWKQRTDKDPPPIFDQTDEQDKETWIVHKILRGHMEDVLDISWDRKSQRLASGSVDNKLLCWDVSKGRSTAILADHKGFVQGVAWDPNDQYIATMSTDRVFRTFDVTTKKVTSRSSRATLPFPPPHPLSGQSVRLYYDDTLQTYFRRLQFSPDGFLIAVPSGHVEPESGLIKPINAVFIYTRHHLKTPACVLPCGDCALVVRWSPVLYRARTEGPPCAFPLPHRMVFAVGTKTSIILYDTQQKTPFAVISNIHYTRLTDLTWSPDGLMLVASSTDGFCSVISFAENELGEILPQPVEPPVENIAPSTPTQVKKPEKFLTNKVQPVNLDVIDETAIAPWSNDSEGDVKPSVNTTKESVGTTILIEDSEDIQLIYQESQTGTEFDTPTQKPDKQIENGEALQKPHPKSPPKVIESKPKIEQNSAPKTPRRVSFVTLSSPSSKKKFDKDKSVSMEVDDNSSTAKCDPKTEQKDAPSLKTPRRVSFITLPSPKTSKNK